MKKLYALLNAVALAATIYVNYLSNTGAIAGKTIGGVSDDLNTLFTPAGYAFAIWGLIYLLLIGFAIYGLVAAFGKVRDDSFLEKTAGWFLLSCGANIAWIFCWLYEWTGWSVVCMFVILIALLVIVVKNEMELYDAAIPTIAFVWWPFVIYSGWITVASIANISAYLHKTNWDGLGLSEVTWTIIVILVAGAVNLAVTWKRNMREFALVGAWALGAIAVANWHTEEAIANTAMLVMGILIGSSTLHAIKNWKYNPLFKLLEYYGKR
ncbi:tryptophan-rich sensory protein [Gilvibacter sp.]|uniref:tryptophan-rich sensory protein n=1 Tax=Gilvibacter sp. TaxID=2729997 RepID=UPI003B52AAAE